MQDNNDTERRKAGVKPWDHPVGSLESRMAMRAKLEERVTCEVVMTGLPWPDANRQVVNPRDSIEHYRAEDGSTVEVIRREYAPGKVTACIHQTWEDGSVYHGNNSLGDLRAIRKNCEKIPL